VKVITAPAQSWIDAVVVDKTTSTLTFYIFFFFDQRSLIGPPYKIYFLYCIFFPQSWDLFVLGKISLTCKQDIHVTAIHREEETYFTDLPQPTATGASTTCPAPAPTL